MSITTPERTDRRICLNDGLTQASFYYDGDWPPPPVVVALWKTPGGIVVLDESTFNRVAKEGVRLDDKDFQLRWYRLNLCYVDPTTDTRVARYTTTYKSAHTKLAQK